MSQIFEDFNEILEYINLIYLPSSNVHKNEVHDFWYNLNHYINKNKNKLTKDKDKNTIIENFIKKLIQFLFYYNLIILKSESSSSIRHYFPQTINQEYSLNLSGEDFFRLLDKYFQYDFIDIKILSPESSASQITYFTVSDYESIIKILLFWDNSGKFINKTSEDREIRIKKILPNDYWEFKFPNEKIIELREIFKKFEIYVYFEQKFIEEIFGENGIIKESGLTLAKFIDSLTLIKKPTRQAIYRWMKKKYIPLTFLIELLKSNYDFDRNVTDKIDSIQIGKSTNRIGMDSVKEIINRYDDWFINFFPPPPSSRLGYIFDYTSLTKKRRKNFLEEFKKYLQHFSEIELENNREIIDTIERIFYKSKTNIILKSLRVRNFKSIKDIFVEFDSGINIFYGLNASGKTSIIAAILFAFFYWASENIIQIKDLYNFNFNFYFEEVNIIRAGQNSCKVELNILSNDENHKIIRELRRDGTHRLTIDDKDVFEKIKNSINIHKIIGLGEKRLELQKSDSFFKKLVPTQYEFMQTIDKYPESEIVKLITDRNTKILIDFGFSLGFMWSSPNIDLCGWNKRYNNFDEKTKKRYLYNDLLLELGRYFAEEVCEYVINEIENFYKEINCDFEKNEIFSSLFSEYGDNNSGAISFEDLVSKKFIAINYLENLEERIRKTTFVSSSRDFFYKEIAEEINSELSNFSEIFKDDGFSTLLDENCLVKIKFSDRKNTYPIGVLSGGEKSKLLLILLNILMDISSRSNFFLIDEPNELLDPKNIEIMKYYFFKLYRNKQVIICTFIDKYKEFQPALVYNVWKDHNNISHVFHLEDKENFELYKKLDEIEKKIEQNPKDYHPHQRKLGLLIKLNRYEEAFDFFQSIKGLGLDLFDDIERLESYLTKIINLHKENEMSKEKKANYYRIRALIFYQLKELHHAIENIDEAMKLGSNMPEIYDMKSHCLLYINKPNKALETLEEGIKLFPDHTGFYNTKGDILEMLGRYEEALVEINKAIEIDKERPWNYYKKAFILGQKMERFEEALVNINKALEFHPDDGIYNADKINYLINNQEYGEAYETLERYKENIPEPNQVFGWIYEEQAFDYANSGKKDEAIDLIKKALALFPDWSEYYHAYGKILMDFGDYENALTKFEKAKELHFTPIETYIKMGKCLYELGKYEEALKHFETGRHLAQHSIKQVTSTKDDKRIAVDFPQTELIEEADNYILKVQDKINLLK